MHFKKVWKYTQIKLGDHENYAIFHKSILSILQLHASNTKDVGFSALVQYLLQKEKVLLYWGEIKYASNIFVKYNVKLYAKKDEKIVHMADRLISPSKVQRSNPS